MEDTITKEQLKNNWKSLIRDLETVLSEVKDVDYAAHVGKQVTVTGQGTQTTKQDKKSVGLGLSVVHGIVKSHHGKIDVQSEPGNTTFTITLPQHTDVREELLAVAAEAGTTRS